MKKLNQFIDRLVYEGDKANLDTYRKGRFFIVSMLLFGFISLSYIPYYLAPSDESIPLVKPLFYCSLIVLLCIFLIYPKYGHRNLLFMIFCVFSATPSFISTYYTTGALYSSDLGMSLVMMLFIFLVTNKTFGIISSFIHIIIYLFYYYADKSEFRDFRADFLALDADYYIVTSIVCFLFATLMILLHEASKEKYLQELKKSKIEIENQKAEIISSISYAQRIQQAKLPAKEEIYAALPDSFVLFKPKDIVSGDFYFYHKKEDTVFIAAADCTGHGVPGALLSMLGSEILLDEVSKNSDLSTILSKLNHRIKASLRQIGDASSTRDGMDIVLCSINLKTRIIAYAGANRPLWLVEKDQSQVKEIPATKKAIGGFTDESQQYESHEIALQQGDRFYLFSDGYADQFGGPQGKKLMTKKLKELFLEGQTKSMRDQENHLADFFENWRGNTEQLDDVLIIGVRV